MMKAIKLFITTLISISIFATIAQAGDWITDIDAGVAKAKKENKSVMVEFTGSDWCPPCMQMHKNVFSKKEFTKKAGEKYILVKIDIPNKDKELRAKNEKVLAKHRVQGVPTVILFDKEGKEFDRFGASEYPTVEIFLSYLDTALEKKEMH